MTILLLLTVGSILELLLWLQWKVNCFRTLDSLQTLLLDEDRSASTSVESGLHKLQLAITAEDISSYETDLLLQEHVSYLNFRKGESVSRVTMYHATIH